MTHSSKYEVLIFDLDGTISDPKQGFVNSINYALEQNGFEAQLEADLLAYIGPPLDQTLMILANSQAPELIEKLIADYRTKYAVIGAQQNILYAGMATILNQLAQNGCQKLGVCTSKKRDFAVNILNHFNLLHLFEFVSGGEVGQTKDQQLAILLNDKIITQNSVMIGDRDVDLIAAQKTGLKSAGVLWGYGSKQELNSHNPDHLLKTPNGLLSLI